MMNQRAFARPTVAGVIESYVAARVGTKHPISTADVLRTVRQALPDCEHTDRELIDIVATIAISQGCNVAFDPRIGMAGALFETPAAPR